jgi:hypothetical protein
MSKKVYTLELTAEELANWRDRAGGCSILKKVQDVADQARVDREADELRLPWKYDSRSGDNCLLSPGWYSRFPSKSAACLASAAPELLEAVQAAKKYIDYRGDWDLDIACDKINRALRKVETGVPE